MARTPLLLRTADLVLNPAARILWRGADSLQLELGGHSVVIDGIDRATVRALLRRPSAAGIGTGTGTDTETDTDTTSGPTCGPGSRTGSSTGSSTGSRAGASTVELLGSFDRDALATLIDEGFVWPAEREAAALAPPPTPRLAADLTSLAARHGAYAPSVLASRRGRVVAVSGRGRAAVHIACLLAASGVGRVYFTDSGDVHLSQTMPGGLPPDAEGRRFAAAAAAAVRAAAPDADTTPLHAGEIPDLTVLAANEPIDSDLRDVLHRRGCAHLVVRLAASSGVVGPLVVPGLTSCVRCADLHRRDRDPAWNSFAVQLTVPQHRGAASDVAVTAALGGVAALHVLEFFDTGTCAAVDGTLELHLPDWRLRRRTWPYHAECGCANRAT